MRTVTIQEAKDQLATIIDEAVEGKEIVISKDGKPAVKVIPINPPKKPRRLGAMKDLAVVARDLDIKSIDRDEIVEMFEGSK